MHDASTICGQDPAATFVGDLCDEYRTMLQVFILIESEETMIVLVLCFEKDLSIQEKPIHAYRCSWSPGTARYGVMGVRSEEMSSRRVRTY